MATQKLALKMRELSKNHNYNKILKQIKTAATDGKRSIQVLKSKMSLDETQQILDEGFTVSHENKGGYECFIISW